MKPTHYNQALYWWLVNNDISLRDLSDISGIHRNTLNDIFKRDRNATLTTYCQILQSLGLTFGDLEKGMEK